MKLRKLAAVISVFITSPALCAPASAEMAVQINVQTDSAGPVISRDIFGQFAEMLGEGIYGGVWVGTESPIPNVRGIRSDVVQALRALKVPNVRWPGGCHADEYDWRDGIGPNRASHINQWGNVLDPNNFGTHEFMDFVEQIGSEAYISVNVGSGTPQSAAHWLEYMTADQPTTLVKERIANGRARPWKVKFVGLGNENWGCGGAMSADHYVEEMKRFGTYVKSYHPEQLSSFFQPNPNAIRKIAVGQDLGNTAYTETVMKAWKTRNPYAHWKIDALSLHYYTGDPTPLQSPSTGFGEKEYARILRRTLKMNDMLAEHSAIMDRYDPDKKIALSIDEWGVWLKPEGKQFMFLRQQNSIRDAIAAALNFNIFIRHAERVKIANIAQMVNVIQSMILTDGSKMLLTPTYHVHKMYVPFQDAAVIPIHFDAGAYTFGDITLPRVDAIAAKAKDGKIWLALTNVDPNQSTEVTIKMPEARPSSVAGEVLTAPKVDAVNSFESPEAVKPVPIAGHVTNGVITLRLPAKSVSVVQIHTAGGK